MQVKICFASTLFQLPSDKYSKDRHFIFKMLEGVALARNIVLSLRDLGGAIADRKYSLSFGAKKVDCRPGNDVIV